MSNTNDQKILDLKTKIEDKKKLLTKLQKFTPITNCSIELDGTVRTNIQTLAKDQIISMMVKLHSYQMAAEDLCFVGDYYISGYKPEEWLADLQLRLDILSRKEEENKLKSMEDTLQRLLSNEKKVELELNDIESMLK